MSFDIKDLMASRAIEAGGRLKVQSALNPVLWMCAIISVPALFISGFSDNPPPWIAYAVFGPICTAILGFFILLIFDRDKLQSEDYQIKKKSLEIYEQKGMKSPLQLSSSNDIGTPDELIENEVEVK
ncbi:MULTISPECIES: hypothetical protein [Aeromonas]|uniref:hypothetical protein n=1 Tax=Aeromonas TaxID=642 RepID=UPI0029D6FE39|nr:hypothetical protein [Aeromonas caviae]MDX7854330.1 hypothetical protein [Aeromonas caviae]